MALQVGELFAKIKIEISQFESDAERARREFKKIADEAEKTAKKAEAEAAKAAKAQQREAERAAKAAESAAAKAAREQQRAAEQAAKAAEDAFRKSMRESQNRVDEFRRHTSDSFRSIGDQARGVFDGIGIKLAGVGIAGSIGLGVKFNADMEQANVAFTTLLGSADKARDMLADFKAFAQQTPFEFPDLLQTSKTLLAMGFQGEQLIPVMTAVGNAVSSLGGGSDAIQGVSLALGQILTKGKVSAEEMNQLAERGIDAWKYLAEGLGKSKAEVMALAEQGKVMASDALPLILSGMNNAAKGAMEAQSRTFLGQISNVKDTLNFALGDATKGLFDKLKDSLAKLSEKVKEMSADGSLKAWTDKISQALSTAWDYTVKFGKEIIQLAKDIKDHWSTVKNVFEFAVIALGGLKLIQTITTLWNGYKIAATFAAEAQAVLNVAMAENPAAVIAIGITALALSLGVLTGALQDLAKNFSGIFKNIGTQFLGIGEIIGKSIAAGFRSAQKEFDTFLAYLNNKTADVFEKFGLNTLAKGYRSAANSFSADADLHENQRSSLMADVSAAQNRVNYAQDNNNFLFAHAFDALPNSLTKASDEVEEYKNRLSEQLRNTASAADKQFAQSPDFSGFGGSGGGSGSPGDALKEAQSAVDEGMQDIRHKLDMKLIDKEEAVAELAIIRDNFNMTKQQAQSLALEMKRLSDEIPRDQFEFSRKWIDQEKMYNRLSANDEVAAWERVSARYEEGTEERIAADQELFRARKDLLDKAVEDNYKATQAQIDANEKSVKDDVDQRKHAYEDDYRNKVSAEQRKSDAVIRGYQSQIDAIDKSRKDAEFSHDQSGRQTDLDDLRKQYDRYKFAVSYQGRAKAKELAKQIADVEYEMAKASADRQADEQKASIQTKIEAERQRVKDQLAVWEDENRQREQAFEDEVKANAAKFDQIRQTADAHHQEMLKAAQQLSTDSLAEINKGQDAVIKALQDRTGSYYDVGKKQVDSYVQGMREAADAARSALGGMAGASGGDTSVTQGFQVPRIAAPAAGGYGSVTTTNLNSPIINVEKVVVPDQVTARSTLNEWYGMAQVYLRSQGVAFNR